MYATCAYVCGLVHGALLSLKNVKIKVPLALMMADDLRQMLGELRNVAIEKLQSTVEPRALIIERHNDFLVERRKIGLRTRQARVSAFREPTVMTLCSIAKR